MEKELRIGIVGAGGIVTGLHLPVLRNIAGVRIAWIADLSEAAAREAATSFGIETWISAARPAGLPACDAVFVATPVHSREPYIAEFARRRTPLFSEKPFALSAGEHQRFQAMYGEAPIGCGYMRRAYGSSRALRTLVRDGWFGPLLGIRYEEGGRVAKTGGGSPYMDLSFRKGGGVLRDLGCHGIDTLGFVSGATGFADVEAAIAWDDETDRDVRSRFSVEVRDADGALRGIPAEFRVTWLEDTPGRLSLRFANAQVSCGVGPGDRLTVTSASGTREMLLMGEQRWATTSYQAFYLEWADFLDSLRNGKAGEYSAQSAFWTTRLVDAIYAAGMPP